MRQVCLLPGLLTMAIASASARPHYLAFSPVDGGWDRACTNDFWSTFPFVPVKEGYLYTTQERVPSILACLNLCGPACGAIEYMPGGQCRLWSLPPLDVVGRSTNIVGSHAPGTTCLRHNVGGVEFKPVDHGYARACRGANQYDNSNSYFQLLPNKTFFDCLGECVKLAACHGVEYHGGGDLKGRCELWTRTIGATASCAWCSNYWCLKIEDQWQPDTLPSSGTPILP